LGFACEVPFDSWLIGRAEAKQRLLLPESVFNAAGLKGAQTGAYLRFVPDWTLELTRFDPVRWANGDLAFVVSALQVELPRAPQGWLVEPAPSKRTHVWLTPEEASDIDVTAGDMRARLPATATEVVVERAGSISVLQLASLSGPDRGLEIDLSLGHSE